MRKVKVFIVIYLSNMGRPSGSAATVTGLRSRKLIQAVQQRPALYDQGSHEFKCVEKKSDLWLDVGEAVYGRRDMKAAEKVKIRWKSLRDAYVKQQKKRKTSNIEIRPYKYEEDMYFLLPHISFRRNYEVFSDDSSNHSMQEESKTTPDLKTEHVDIDDHIPDAEDSEMKPQFVDSSNPFLWEADDGQSVAATSTDEQCKCDHDGKMNHPVDAFFHGIAQTVKQLSPTSIAKIKKLVANAVMDAELSELGAGPSMT